MIGMIYVDPSLTPSEVALGFGIGLAVEILILVVVEAEEQEDHDCLVCGSDLDIEDRHDPEWQTSRRFVSPWVEVDQ